MNRRRRCTWIGNFDTSIHGIANLNGNLIIVGRAAAASAVQWKERHDKVLALGKRDWRVGTVVESVEMPCANEIGLLGRNDGK